MTLGMLNDDCNLPKRLFNDIDTTICKKMM